MLLDAKQQTPVANRYADLPVTNNLSDDLPEGAFSMVGSVEQAIEKAKTL